MKANRKNILKTVLFIGLSIVLTLLIIFIEKGALIKEQHNKNASMVPEGNIDDTIVASKYNTEETENKDITGLEPATYTIEIMQETLTGKEG